MNPESCSLEDLESDSEKLLFVEQQGIELPKWELKQLKCRARLEDPYFDLGGGD